VPGLFLCLEFMLMTDDIEKLEEEVKIQSKRINSIKLSTSVDIAEIKLSIKSINDTLESFKTPIKNITNILTIVKILPWIFVIVVAAAYFVDDKALHAIVSKVT
jgi:hypothetical protein